MLQFFRSSLESLDPAVAGLIENEAERQGRKLILIPSESQAPLAVREALGSVFQNIYAEGYPDPSIHGAPQEAILDYEVQLAHYRRYSDLRYYKGVEYVDVLESLARRRAAEAFSTETVPPEEIWANVQPLSGSPANSAIYAALVPPGSTVMGMDLLHGGHLTHGSPANRSGKLYNIVPYGIDLKSERLDYEAIEELAHRQSAEGRTVRMIIAGYTSYPWMPDWARFRQIADSVGAYLLADISHIAGMVAAGVVASPVGHAHVISFTTHKTLYGPRGACILTTDKKLAAKIDAAVFPGEQGGPHVNTMAAMAVSFELARSPEFAQLQFQVVENARHLAAELEKHGLRIPYGGTDTHMLLADCKSIRADFGVSPDGKPGTPLMGDSTARVLDIAGIVLNRNTIPGDRSARNPSGIRLGTPWITQRGFRAPEIERLAAIIGRVLKATEPYAYAGRHGPVYRAKMSFDVLEEAKRDVVDLACSTDLASDYCPSGYPHHYFMYKPTKDPGGDWDIIEIEGTHARGFCNVAMTNDVYALGPGESQPTWILEPDGQPMSGGLLKCPGKETTCFQLLIPKSVESRVAHWFRALSDGYVHMDDEDVFAKTPGPVVVRRLPHALAKEWQSRPPTTEAFDVNGVGWAFHKPYWIGQRARADAPGGLEPLPEFAWEEPTDRPLQRTPLYDLHRQAGAKMAPFAGWEMPIRYSSVQDEHLAVRQSAGLFDVSHMGLFEFSGDNVHLFINTLTTNDISLLKPGQSHYSYLLDHKGHVLDDVYVYRLDEDQYWMVLNAANNEKDWAWVSAVRDAEVMIDPERPWSRALGTETVIIRNMRDSAQGAEMRVQLALQGPRSRDILLSMLDEGDPLREPLLEMKRNEILRGRLAGYDLYLARTGYTGEPIGFEVFVHPAAAAALWHALLESGEPFGLEPIGLAARDSLRIEAGLPLYGHELAGPLGLNPADAGFAPYVKLHKPFFIGKATTMAHERERQSRLVRFRFDEAHARMPRQGDVVVSQKGRVAGAVTSCSIDSDGWLTGLAYVQNQYAAVGTRLGIFQVDNRSWTSKPLEELQAGDRIQLHDDITVVRRFLDKRA
ncbi:MAG TPA: glycine cleavage system aminomethyltransferase GcvT [Anaerolineae bacterium]|nr:glycine cleavage system aminomethyltransferase GcvT [Anaerolineae bacterium]